MYLKQKTPLWTVLFLFLPSFASADLNHLDLKGIDALVDHPGASPIYGYTALKTFLENRRFLGNYGDSTAGVFCSDRKSSIGEQLRANHDCPLDATSEWIQRLFPSQDGVNFVANQVGGDPVSHLTPEVIGRVLERIAEVPDSDWNSDGHRAKLESDLAEILFQGMNPKKYRDTKLTALRTELAEKKRKGCSPDELEPLEGQIAGLNRQILEIAERGGSPVSVGSEEGAPPPAAGAGRASPHSDSEAALKKGVGDQKDYQGIARILVVALKESRVAVGSHAEGPAAAGAGAAAPEVAHTQRYPKYLPEQALLAFFIKKSDSKKDLVSLFRGMPSLIKDKDFLSNEHKQEVFIALKWEKKDASAHSSTAPGDLAKEFAHHPEHLVFAMMEENKHSLLFSHD